MKQRLQQSLLGDVLRKATLSGVGEIRLPGDLRKALVSNIEKMRENAVDIFAKEVSKVLARVDVKRIVDDVLQNYTLRVEAHIDLVPKSSVKKPTAKLNPKKPLKKEKKV
jgi:hypothetical protein